MSLKLSSRDAFSALLLDWFDIHGRHDLPWQHPRSAYRVWISEVMLQQTQVGTVIGYFERWMQRFPDLKTLSNAALDDVLAAWSGLGYYARARNIKRAADFCATQLNGELPTTLEGWLKLPGVGPSTAAAVLAQAFGARAAILDGNVKRVLARISAQLEPIDSPSGIRSLQALADSLLPHSRLADYTQAQMDLGATLCTQRDPACTRCPVERLCQAKAQQQVAQFPIKAKRLKRKHRHIRWLVCQREDGAILLEQRPPSGIWGALRSFPECPTDAKGAEIVAQLFALKVTNSRALDTFTHAFTHFDLTIEPLLLSVSETSVRETATELREASSERFYKPSVAMSLGLPQPVRKLLIALEFSQLTDHPTEQ